VTRLLAPLVWGGVFGLGLAISGMTRPEKVMAFLDVTGAWDPTLVFVMGAALVVVLLARPVVVRARGAVFPSLTAASVLSVEPRVVVGAALFGAGWGLAGYCPGPAIASLGTGSLEAVIVVVAMLLGIRVVDLAPGRDAQSTDPDDVDSCA
jgi:uncharacterized membrane protein YedE/YeeE